MVCQLVSLCEKGQCGLETVDFGIWAITYRALTMNSFLRVSNRTTMCEYAYVSKIRTIRKLRNRT